MKTGRFTLYVTVKFLSFYVAQHISPVHAAQDRVSVQPGFFSSPDRFTEITGTKASSAFSNALRSRWM